MIDEWRSEIQGRDEPREVQSPVVDDPAPPPVPPSSSVASEQRVAPEDDSTGNGLDDVSRDDTDSDDASAPPQEQYEPDVFALLGDVLQFPRRAFAYLARPEVERGGLAVLVYFLSQMPSNLARSPFSIAVETTAFRLLGNAAASVLGFAVAVGVLHLFGRMLGGRNSYGKLFQSMATATLPGLLTAPFVAWSMYSGADGFGAASGLAAGIWTFILQIVAIREVYRFSTGRALATLFLPTMIFVGLIMVLVVIAVLLGVDILSGIEGL